jgi:hypothetical protein
MASKVNADARRHFPSTFVRGKLFNVCRLAHSCSPHISENSISYRVVECNLNLFDKTATVYQRHQCALSSTE